MCNISGATIQTTTPSALASTPVSACGRRLTVAEKIATASIHLRQDAKGLQTYSPTYGRKEFILDSWLHCTGKQGYSDVRRYGHIVWEVVNKKPTNTNWICIECDRKSSHRSYDITGPTYCAWTHLLSDHKKTRDGKRVRLGCCALSGFCLVGCRMSTDCV